MKYKKIMFMLVLAVFLLSITCVSASEIDDTLASEDTNTIGLSVDNDIIEDNLQTSEENDELALTDNDETLSAKNDTDVLSDNSGTYSGLSDEIGSGGNIELQHDYYTYDTGDTIFIRVADSVIDGKGATIDMTGSNICAFEVRASGVTIKNLTIINANSEDSGGAICFDSTGTVSNCNFVDNYADFGAAIYFSDSGNVTNCNFTRNIAGEWGGAVFFDETGTVSNCNFVDNKATGDYSYGGAVYFDINGEVTNCNFTGNNATVEGGAVYFYNNGTVTNCNFADNSAISGGAIFSVEQYTTADTCIFKRNSRDNVNTVIYPPTLNVDDFKTFYGSGEKLTFDLKTNSSIPVTNGNISISVYFKDNGTWVGNYSCLSGEGWIPNLPVGSYIAVFNTEYAEFKPINRTITVNKIKTELSGNAITTTYNINKDLIITLKDSNGNPVSGAKLIVDLNGAKTYTTDKNGQVKVSTKGLAPKTYTAKVTFNGDTNYDKSTKDIKVTVKKATPKLTAKKKTFKTSVKTKKYTITLKDNTGKAIKKAKVTLKVKGKTYKATTNSKGKAVFKIKKLNKKGTFKATITYKGNKYYNKVSKKANIKVIVTFKTVSKGSKDKSTVKEIQQALKDHGYYLSYKGHYLKVDGKFQSCTERSVKQFQKDKGLKVTGKVDEKTAKKLGLI